ncbi:TetR/AcrR family transcriptional regulator [Cellulomonas sp. KRMCY2]|uniref:TetR/AcrR family transcriptional regulator n=1 Tax=Cellulomonas sp. KRMCY2 TaxID=1304865 RepID=UPI0004A38434|nr:TetR/AcrR family transcriptional regulator [Cellulomonas sp. KRMCY2]
MTANRSGSSDAEPLRADAERNRARILAAARQAFAEQGLDVATTDIARAAGVGIATLYRRFPATDDLVAAAFTAKMDAYAGAAEAALDVEDPWVAFCDYVRAICEMQSLDAGFADILALAPRPAFDDQRSRAFRAFTRLVRRAKDVGALRHDFVHQDLVMLLMANAGLVRSTNGNPQASRRLAEYMLQSFRSPGAGPLPPPPSARGMFRALQDGAT